MKYFLLSFSPLFADSRRAVVSFWQKNVHNTAPPKGNKKKYVTSQLEKSALSGAIIQLLTIEVLDMM